MKQVNCSVMRFSRLNKDTDLRAIEDGFPIGAISRLSERESWRKEIYRPTYYIHKWWARRLGSVFRAILLGSCVDGSQDVEQLFYSRVEFPDVVVFDPFMGSGTTIGEAVKLGCNVGIAGGVSVFTVIDGVATTVVSTGDTTSETSFVLIIAPSTSVQPAAIIQIIIPQ